MNQRILNNIQDNSSQQHLTTASRKEPLAFKITPNLYFLNPGVPKKNFTAPEIEALKTLHKSDIFIINSNLPYRVKNTDHTGDDLFWLWMFDIIGDPDIQKPKALEIYLTERKLSEKNNELLEEIPHLLHNLAQKYKILQNIEPNHTIVIEGCLHHFSYILHYMRFKISPLTQNVINSIIEKYKNTKHKPWALQETQPF